MLHAFRLYLNLDKEIDVLIVAYKRKINCSLPLISAKLIIFLCGFIKS